MAESERCPVTGVDFRLDRTALWHFDELPRFQREADIWWNTTCGGFWMVTRHDHVREALQRPDLFSNETISPFHRDQELRLVPQVLDGAEHRAYRHVLNPWFSPSAVAKLLPDARVHCEALVAELAPTGSCDLATSFGLRFPTDLFLHHLGLPPSDGARFRPSIEAIFAGFFGGDTAAAGAAIGDIYRYFESVRADRVANPRDPTTDFVSYLLTARIDGEPLPASEIRTICMTLSLAGLDTTRAQLGYIFHHLATHSDDRRHLVAHPEAIPAAVEEFLRLYGLILTAGRRVTTDVEFHGVPMNAGDVVWLGLLQANRDPARFDRPDRYAADRAPNPHLAFAGGVHRCLGAQLARAELAVAIEVWHRLIPDYRLAEDAGELVERGGQLTLRHLPLRWDV